VPPAFIKCIYFEGPETGYFIGKVGNHPKKPMDQREIPNEHVKRILISLAELNLEPKDDNTAILQFEQVIMYMASGLLTGIIFRRMMRKSAKVSGTQNPG
jgi:hypothetical protein